MTDEIPGWWALTSSALMGMLRQVEAGETADLVYAEHYANSAIEPEPSGDDE